MAKATNEHVTVEHVVKEVKKIVRLDLTHEEAETLADILGWVGGNFNSRRKYAYDISEALDSAGFKSTNAQDLILTEGIYFTEAKKRQQQ